MRPGGISAIDPRAALRRAREGGVSLIELVSVTAVILVLASITIPVAATMVKRQKEIELRRALRTMRAAIDQFQADAMSRYGAHWRGAGGMLDTTNEEGFPQELEWLVEGMDTGGAAEVKIKYLRRLPVDPFMNEAEWDTRSSRDPPDAMFTDGINVFDVRSKCEKLSLDGKTHYNEW